MYFDGYGYHGTSFEQTYRCYPASFIEKSQIESGDKIIMPPSALDRLASLHIDYPMLFELQNDSAERVSHCGVLEFIAEEGMIYMPYWMMENLLLQEGDFVKVKNVTLPKGAYVKLQVHTKDFLDISNPKAILETTLRNYSCLTTGDSIMVAYNNKKYYIDIIETKPSNAISIIETDCEVDFAPPLDYKEPEKPVPVSQGKAPMQAEVVPKFNPFTGSSRRLDGKPLSPQPPPVSTAASKDQQLVSSSNGKPSEATTSKAPVRQTQGKLVFGSNANRTPQNTKKAVVNEDSTGDVIALQNQIRLLKEELSALRRQNVSRSLVYNSTALAQAAVEIEQCTGASYSSQGGEQEAKDLPGFESNSDIRLSNKQLKSLESTLAGALRREQMMDTTIKQLEAEIVQLNLLVQQREEDRRCTEMILKFREEKIQRMESLLGGSISSETYLHEENKYLSEEIQLLQARVDKNTEVTRFALENIRLLDQLRRFQEFYEEGEREILLEEVARLRDEDDTLSSKENASLHLELKNTSKELEECRLNHNACLEENARLDRELHHLRSELDRLRFEDTLKDGNRKLQCTGASYSSQGGEQEAKDLPGFESNSGIRLSNQQETCLAQIIDSTVDEECPFFEVTIPKCTAEGKYLHVPDGFSRSHLRKAQASKATLKLIERSWQIELIDYDRSYRMARGWGQFARDNYLRIGDICSFKLIDKVQFVFEVSITKP